MSLFDFFILFKKFKKICKKVVDKELSMW